MTFVSMRREDRQPLHADIRVDTGAGADATLTMFDISSGGIGTDGLVPLTAGTMVRIVFPDGTVKRGRTIWREDFCSGILFDDALDGAELARLVQSLQRQPLFR